MIKFIQETYRTYRTLKLQLRKNAPYNVRFYNFWEQDNPDMWLYQFIQSRKILDGKDKRICFYSTFGPRSFIDRTKGDVNVFFTGENLKTGRHHQLYSDHFLNDPSINLAIGFEYFDDSKYFRFPLWMMYIFDPASNDDAIIKRCQDLRHPLHGRHQKFACMISRVDVLGIRKAICEQLSNIQRVDCAGKVMHNCDDLWKVYADDKSRFISEYKFNICPENSNCAGYVTEKVFQAIDAGCIPIYWGSYNNPEPEVLNPDAIVFWEKDGDNAGAIDLVARLEASPDMYEEFMHQPRLKEGAEEYVLEQLHSLDKRIRELL